MTGHEKRSIPLAMKLALAGGFFAAALNWLFLAQASSDMFGRHLREHFLLFLLPSCLISFFIGYRFSAAIARRPGFKRSAGLGAAAGALVGIVNGTLVFPVIGTAIGAGLGLVFGAVAGIVMAKFARMNGALPDGETGGVTRLEQESQQAAPQAPRGGPGPALPALYSAALPMLIGGGVVIFAVHYGLPEMRVWHYSLFRFGVLPAFITACAAAGIAGLILGRMLTSARRAKDAMLPALTCCGAAGLISGWIVYFDREPLGAAIAFGLIGALFGLLCGLALHALRTSRSGALRSTAVALLLAGLPALAWGAHKAALALGKDEYALAAAVLKPGNAAAQSRAARYYLRAFLPNDAEHKAMEAVALAPDQSAGHLTLAIALLQKQIDSIDDIGVNRAGALESCNKALALSPDMAVARILRGSLLAMSRDLAPAAQDFDRAIALTPGEPWLSYAYTFRASARLSDGEYERARSDAQKAIRISPQRAEAKTLLSAVERESSRGLSEAGEPDAGNGSRRKYSVFGDLRILDFSWIDLYSAELSER